MRSRESIEVIEFQGAGLGASVPALIRKRAAAAVALVDCSLDGIGNVARTALADVLIQSFPSLPARREALLLDAFDQKVERPVDDRRNVSVGDAVPHQILCLAQL